MEPGLQATFFYHFPHHVPYVLPDEHGRVQGLQRGGRGGKKFVEFGELGVGQVDAHGAIVAAVASFASTPTAWARRAASWCGKPTRPMAAAQS